MFGQIFLIAALVWLSSCASLYHVQVGSIDGRSNKQRPFEIKVSEVGVNLEDAKQIMRRTSKNKDAALPLEYLQYTQMGPSTGNPVFDEHYANDVLNLIYKECPTGKVSGLLSIRENARYPVISGEIVKITGWCIL